MTVSLQAHIAFDLVKISSESECEFVACANLSKTEILKINVIKTIFSKIVRHFSQCAFSSIFTRKTLTMIFFFFPVSWEVYL